MFNEKSIVVRTWVNLVKKGVYTMEQVPDLGNLREMVALVISTETEG